MRSRGECTCVSAAQRILPLARRLRNLIPADRQHRSDRMVPNRSVRHSWLPRHCTRLYCRGLDDEGRSLPLESSSCCRSCSSQNPQSCKAPSVASRSERRRSACFWRLCTRSRIASRVIIYYAPQAAVEYSGRNLVPSGVMTLITDVGRAVDPLVVS